MKPTNFQRAWLDSQSADMKSKIEAYDRKERQLLAMTIGFGALAAVGVLVLVWIFQHWN